jgi:hypothetical protein
MSIYSEEIFLLYLVAEGSQPILIIFPDLFGELESQDLKYSSRDFG